MAPPSLALQACGGQPMTNEAGRVPGEEPLAYYLAWTTLRYLVARGRTRLGREAGPIPSPGSETRGSRPAADDRAATYLGFGTALPRGGHNRRPLPYPPLASACRQLQDSTRPCGRDSAQSRSGDVMDQFKAWCTRRLKERERARDPVSGPVRQNWWTQRGSKRSLNDEQSLEEAIHYVLEGQGDPTPRTDRPPNDAQA